MEQIGKSIWVKYLPFILIFLLAAYGGISKIQSIGNAKKMQVIYLHTTNNSPPEGERVFPEKRRKFALDLRKKFTAGIPDAKFTTTGDFHTTFAIQGSTMNEPIVFEMMNNHVCIGDMRAMGFKTLTMTDGKIIWNIDLKN